MKKVLFLILLSFQIIVSYSQGGWTWSQLPNMPFKTSNNATASAKINDTTFIFSFLGIDTTKTYSGIHLKSARYNTITSVWDTIPNVPDSLGGLIAAGATTIKNKIVIIGGYHVYPNSTEISTKHIYIYDPQTNQYTRGKDIPVEIDDHVQIPYKDSLIYVITGWTSSIGGGNNTNAVQVYDAVNDEWYAATATPNSNTFKVFGASGTIVNDTIFYAGGARVSSNFSLVQALRKGIIDANDPLSITWSFDTVFNNFKPYRASCLSINKKVFWIGGSSVSYNYDGLAYSNGAGVSPNNFITEYNSRTNQWEQYSPTDFNIMDLRGIAKISKNTYVICGGMKDGQEVTNNTFQLTYDTTFLSSTDSIIENTNTLPIQLFEQNILNIKKDGYIYTIENKDVTSIQLVDLFGRTIKHSAGNTINVLGVHGIFFIQAVFDYGAVGRKKVLIN